MLSWAKEITDVLDMLNVLTEQNLEYDKDLLLSKDIDVVDDHHDSVDKDLILNTNNTVKNDEAIECFNICKKWAEENNISLYEVQKR